MIQIFIINFNTNKLTNNCIESIFKNIKSFNFCINIFDNSTFEKFQYYGNHNINIIDNTEGKLIDFNKVIIDNVDLNMYKFLRVFDKSNHGSLKHTYTIDYIINSFYKNFILFDSDTILKKDIDFIDDQYITIADICYQEPTWKNRFLPFLQYFNVKKIKENNIQYFDKNRISFGNNLKNSLLYDTGASFYEDVINNKLNYKQIKFNEYIDHLACGSWTNSKTQREMCKRNYNKNINILS